MGEAKNNKETEKGFVVKDRRFSAKEGAEGESHTKEQGKKEEVKTRGSSQAGNPSTRNQFHQFHLLIEHLSTYSIGRGPRSTHPTTGQGSPIGETDDRPYRNVKGEDKGEPDP